MEDINPFEDFADAEFVEEKEIKVQPRGKVYGLSDIINTYSDYAKHVNHWSHYKMYEKAQKAAFEIDYSIAAIEEFCYDLSEYIGNVYFYSLGFFISALINKKIKATDEIKLCTDCPISYLGYDLKQGRLAILSSVGTGLGFHMSGGEIECWGDAMDEVGHSAHGGAIDIRGNANNLCGYCNNGCAITVYGSAGETLGKDMYSGKIFVYEDVGSSLGMGMVGGSIRVYGSAGTNIGQHMAGGLISVKGDIEQLSYDINGGEIYCGDKLVYPNDSLVNSVKKKFWEVM